jgi:spectinomycin phosphotransferase
VNTPPDELDEGALADELHAGWGVEAARLEYAAVGFGSHHWTVTTDDGARLFATVDDLDNKAWMGDTRDAVFAGLAAAFDTAAALAAAGLPFVVAPRPTDGGRSVRRIDDRYVVALFPFVDGRSGEFDDEAGSDDVVDLLAALHAATGVARSCATTVGLDLPGRACIEAALRDADRPWSGGPYSEAVRAEITGHRDDIVEVVALADRFAHDVGARGGAFVATHGEPHPGNVMRTLGGPVLVDWDTVSLAPPERDLWILTATPDDPPALRYAAATGRRLDPDALDFFRLTWDLRDLAEYLHVLRSPHLDTEDTAQAFEGVQHCVRIRGQWEARILGGAPTTPS